MSRSPFPLQWPEGMPRARYRDASAFDKSRGFVAAREGVYRQLELFNASHIVITSNLPTNASGKPSSAGPGYITDPGIAVWWVKKGTEHVIACDRWQSVVENMRALEKTLEAIRGIARWGSTEMVDRAFAGFAALPPGNGSSTYTSPERPTARPKTWRELFGVNIEPWSSLPKSDLLSIVKARHREQIKEAHPDRPGGSLERTQQLNAALTSAELELKLK